MKNILTKKKFVALFAMVCAFVLLLVGIPFAAAPASAAETRGTYIPTKPTIDSVANGAIMSMTYTGDVCDYGTNYLYLGENINPNYGYRTVEGSVYSEVLIPYEGISSISSRYPWVRSIAKIGDMTYQSDTLYLSSFTYPLNGTIEGSITSGTLNTILQGLDFDSTGKTQVVCTCVYNGRWETKVINIPTTSGTYNPESITVWGMPFGVLVFKDQVQVKTTLPLTCSTYSYDGSYTGGFAFYAV